MTRVAIALGSNLGDRRAHLDYAVSALAIDLQDLVISAFRETSPVGVGDEHGTFVNGVIVGQTALAPRLLLDRLLEIEQERGRARPYFTAPRTLDLDLILYGQEMINEDGLSVPHPRFRQRSFVLGPLMEIAPEMVDPVTQRTVAELYRELEGR